MVNYNEAFGAHPVYFDERKERAIKLACTIPGSTENRYFYVRDDGLCVANVVPFSKPNVRQVTVGEEVKSLVFHENSGLFTVICKLKKPSEVLKFVDKRYLKLLESEEMPYKNNLEHIFAADMDITCSCVWNVVKEGNVSKRLVLVGCSDSNGNGMVKVLDIAKVYKEDLTAVKVTELFSYTLESVPSDIIQVGGKIFYSGKKSLYSIDYDPERKSFAHTDQVLSLPSNINSFYTKNGSLYVITTEDSVFEYEPENSERMKQTSHDTFKRSVTNVAVTSKSDIFLGEHNSSFVVNIVKDNSFLRTTWSYTFPFIPRVYPTKTSFGRSKDHWSNGILCVGIDGSIVVLQSVPSNSNAISLLNQHIQSLNGDEDADLKSRLTDRIADTFNYPIVPSRNMGRGLLVLNKPCFDFEGNSSKLVDCDIEQIQQICSTIEF